MATLPRHVRLQVAAAAVLMLLGIASHAHAASPGISLDEAFQLALDHLHDEPEGTGLRRVDLREYVVAVHYQSERSGTTHIVLRQRIRGIEVWNGDLAINVARDGRILNVHNGFVARTSLVEAIPAAPLVSAEHACSSAGRALGLRSAAVASRASAAAGVARTSVLHDPQLSLDPIPAKLMWQQDDAGSLRLVWNLILREPTGRHWWDLNVDAQTGELSSRVDWGRRARYRAFALQVSSPDEGARSLHVDPADAMASPWGWHDIDGAVGGDSTDTRGNNVFAQEDVAATSDGNGFRPSGGGSLNFDFPLDLNQDPSASQSAAITNAFYLTNTLHDIYYRYGFDEAAGNFQVNNYGNGGALACPEDADSTQGNDPALVDVQDGRERNNAVFFTPPDGSPPLMELYVYTNAVAELEVTAPAPIAGAYVAGDAAFGALLTDAGISAAVVQALDAANADGPTTTDGCSPFSNAADVAGKIALIDRGVCLFVEKVENAESAGAVAAIIVNHLGDGVLGMGAGPPGGPRPTLPSLLIGQSDGDAIKAQLGGGVSANLRRDPGGLRDSALSNDLVTHEYTHGLTTRLTGGKCNSSCLTSAQGDGMSEGWSDWYELTLGAAASDARDGSYPVATYLNFEPPTGAGIRSLPYSTDLAVNALSYADIATQSQPHGVGEVWASALWDLYWNLVDAHGFDSDLYAGSGGNNLALQIVTDALKLQPCEPSFLDARDAILLADQALGQANQCAIWHAFAKRGMGEAATDGGSPSSLSVGEDFGVPIECPEPDVALLSAAAGVALAWLRRTRSRRRRLLS